MRANAGVMLFLMVVGAAQEARTLRLFWLNNVGSGEAKMNFKNIMRLTYEWSLMNLTHLMFLAYVCASVVAMIILCAELPDGPGETSNSTALVTAGRRLRGTYYYTTDGVQVFQDENVPEAFLWLFFSVSIMLQVDQ